MLVRREAVCPRLALLRAEYAGLLVTVFHETSLLQGPGVRDAGRAGRPV